MKYLSFLSLFILTVLHLPLAGQTQDWTLENVSPTQASQLLEEGALFLDVREKNEVDILAYDVKPMLNIPLSELANRLEELPLDKQLVLACRTGNRSRQAATILVEEGYTNLVNLDGGILTWQEENFAVVQQDRMEEMPNKNMKGQGCNAKCESGAAGKGCAKGESSTACCSGKTNAKAKAGKKCCSGGK